MRVPIYCYLSIFISFFLSIFLPASPIVDLSLYLNCSWDLVARTRSMPRNYASNRMSIGARARPIANITESDAQPIPPEVVQVMDEINSVWPTLTEDSYNPVPTALWLLDSTSLGRDYKSFCEVCCPCMRRC